MISTFIYSVFVVAFDLIVNWVAQWIVDLENHKYVSDAESSLTFKLYILSMINANLGLFEAAFISRNHEVVLILLISLVFVKEIVFEVLSYLVFMCKAK